MAPLPDDDESSFVRSSGHDEEAVDEQNCLVQHPDPDLAASSQSPFKESSPASSSSTSWRDEIRFQSKTAFPTLAGMILNKIPWIISLRFVGEIGAAELAAAALATTLANVTGLSLSVGLSSAITTLTGQARGGIMQQKRRQRRMMETGNNVPMHKIRGGDDDYEEDARLLHDGKRTSSDVDVDDSDHQQQLLSLVYLYRGLFIQLLIVVPVGGWWIYGIQPVLLQLGQREEVSAMTADYLRILAPGLWGYSINWTLTAWLQAIEMADVPAVCAAIGLLLHVPANYFFIYIAGFGYLGCAVATLTFQLLQPILMILYLFVSRAGSQRVLQSISVGRSHLSFWPEAWTAATSWSGIRQYLGLALPGIVTISEWWASEVAIFLSGRLVPSPELALGAMSLYQSINSFCFMFPVAFSVAGATRVANLLGANKARAAAFAATVTILCAGTVSGMLGVTLFIMPHTLLPSFLAPAADDLIRETSRTIPLLSIYLFADGLQCAFNGIVKGSGRQVVTMAVVVIAYWLVGVPLSYYLAFVRNNGQMTCENEDDSSYFLCGTTALITGLTAGTWVHMLLLGAIVLGRTNWGEEAKKAQKRLQVEGSKNIEQSTVPHVREEMVSSMEMVAV